MITRRKMKHLGGNWWWAGEGFLRPGLYLGAFQRNIRVLPAFWKRPAPGRVPLRGRHETA